MASSSHQQAREVPVDVAAAAVGEVALPEAAAAAEAVLPEAAAAAGEEPTLPEAGAGQTALPGDMQLDEGRQIVDADGMQSERGTGGNIGDRWACLSLTTPMSARYIYAGIFLLAIFVAWEFRENPITYFWEQRRSGCQGDRACLAAEGVLIISLTVFLFYFVMFWSTIGTRTVQDRRNKWHSQCWLLKVLLLLVCLGASVYIPYEWNQLYGKAAHFGAGVSLALQLISVVRFITWLNYKWCQTNIENHYRKVIAVSVLAYIASSVWIILMFYWYAGYSRMNRMFIAITLGLVILMFLISRLSKSPGFYMEPGLMGGYIVFLCWSTIKSEPDTGGSGDKWKSITAFIAVLIGITYSTFSTGADGIRFCNVVETAENHVPYGYGFFHLVFATGCMYFGMLIVSWDTHHTSEMWSMDVGRTSIWVHFSNELLAFIAFVAVFIARRYEIGWLQQLLGKIFGIDFQQQENNNDAHQTQPEGSTDIAVPPEGSRATDAERSEDNGPPPPESSAGTELERSEMGDNGPPPSSSSTLADLFRMSPSSSSLVIESDDSDEIVVLR